MSHPFTLEYMEEGETSSYQISRDVKKRKENQEGSVKHESQMKSKPRTKMFEDKSVTNSYEIESDGERRASLAERDQEMNNTIPNEESMSFYRMAIMTIRHRIETFSQEVSIVGLSYLVKPSSSKVGSIIRKIMWTMLLLFGAGFMVFQIYDRVSYYLTYPTMVNYQVAYNRSLRFPTVTICSECALSRKSFSYFGPQAQEFIDVPYPPLWDVDFGERSMNMSILDFDWELFTNYVVPKTYDMMLGCSFGNLPCNASDAIESVTTDQGSCMLFNPVTANYVTTHPGANNGLRLALWVNQSDCGLIWSPGVGFKVTLHDPRDQPVVEDVGFRVGTGISTSTSFSLRNVSMLPSPYGDCRPNANYTFMRCYMQCLGDYAVSECKCRPFQIVGNTKVCSLDAGYNCLMKVIKKFISSGAANKCDCPLQCYLPSYPFSVSTSPLSQHFLKYMSQHSKFKGRNLTTTQMRDGLVYLDIFYSDMNYVDIQTTPAYDFFALVCDCSGALGLILGGTLLTIAEIFQFFLQLINEIATSARFARMQRR